MLAQLAAACLVASAPEPTNRVASALASVESHFPKHRELASEHLEAMQWITACRYELFAGGREAMTLQEFRDFAWTRFVFSAPDPNAPISRQAYMFRTLGSIQAWQGFPDPTHAFPLFRSGFDQLDLNRDGVVSRDEYDRLADQSFKHDDLDGDGLLSKAEDVICRFGPSRVGCASRTR